MRSISLIVAALYAAFALSSCASRTPRAEHVPPLVAKPAPIAKNNRFNMSQNGRRMSADDFDAWMKARGIRVAKGVPSAKPKPKPRAAVRAKAAPKATASSSAKPKPKAKPGTVAGR